MRIHMIVLGAASAVTVVLAACAPATAARPPAAQPGPFESLVTIADDRLMTADTVAAVKWGSHAAVEDPAREQAVLTTAVEGAAPRGLGAAEVASVFRDQIQANKVVQYGLLEDWTAEPNHAPQAAPDLTSVRVVLDQVTPRLLDALAATADTRRATDCVPQVLEAARRVSDVRGLDALHRRGLDRAVHSLCS